MPAAIINHRIDGLRVTVFDVLHYRLAGRSAKEISEILPLSLDQVESAFRCIDEHRDEVMATHRQIEERIARGNPPEVEAKARASRAKMDAWIQEQRRNTRTEANGEGNPRGHQ
jgi:uncharacterized protein (DUF433 family)